jgi:multidrug resistance efflux pump
MNESLFRAEALEHVGRVDSDVLRLSPAWTRWAYWILAAAFITLVLYVVLGKMHEYGTGPAVVWVAGRSDLTAAAASTVTTVAVRPGQRVDAGTRLVEFDAANEKAELDRLESEFDLQFIRMLRDPSDSAARQALTSLRAQKELAAARLRERSLHAPRAGMVGAILVRPGQRLAAGDTVVTLVDDQAGCSIVAMLPAHYRPQLEPGTPLRFEVGGYRYAYREALIESVGDQIIGPEEARRSLGQELGDSVKLDGPLVLVATRPITCDFEIDRRTFNFYHGMHGIAQARVRSERILLALLPSLRALSERWP